MSTIILTETQIQPTADPTPTIVKINLICEDRDTGKKCLFKDLKITLLQDQTFQIIELIEKNRSLQYFLNNCMIFQPSDDDMDIMVGLYPSEDISNQNLTYDQKANITLKFEKIRPPSSESKNEENQLVQSNQNQIPNNKQTNNKNNNNQKINNINNAHATHSTNNESNLNALALSTQNTNFSESILLDSKNLKVEGDSMVLAAAEANKSDPAQVMRSQLSQEDLNNMESQTISSPIESEGSLQNLETQVATKIAAPSSQIEGSTFLNKNQSAFIKAEGSANTQNDQQLNRKRKVSEALDECSESCSEGQNESSPCNSINGDDIPKNKKVQQNIKNNKIQQEQVDVNNIFSSSMNLNLNGKFPVNLYGQTGLNNGLLNQSLNECNPNNNGFNSTQFNGNIKSIDNTVLNGFSFMDNQFLVNDNAGGNGNNSANNNLNRQSRNKERTIREAIEMVTKWRDLQEDYRQKHQVKGLQEVADELNISKKELRTAEFFGFDFDSNLGNKMGVLRKYIDEQKKNHEQKNKNFKITRNLQFKYRLKDYQGSSFLSSCSSNNINNNDALSSTSSQKSKEKLLQKNQVKIEQITSLISQGQYDQAKTDEMEIEHDKSFNFPNINGASAASLASLNNTQSNTSNNQNIQDILSKNSPLFLQFLNNSSNTSKQNSKTPNNSSSQASQMGFNLTNNNTTNNNTSLSNALNPLNFLQSLNNNGFQVNQSHNDIQRKQQSQQVSSQNTNDKNISLFDFLFNQQGQQMQYPSILKKETSSNDKMSSSTNQIDNLYTLIKMLSTNDETNELPSFQKSHSASSGYGNSKFQDDDNINKQQKLMKPQKVSVIQIRKQDE